MPSTCSVSGNLQDLTGTGIAGYAVFTLANYGSNVPRVIGTSVIASKSITFTANASGVIAGSCWGNDNINPTGTIYIVTIEDANRVPIQAYAFSITGTTFNLNTAPAITNPATTASFNPLSLNGQTAAISNTTLYTPTAHQLFRFTWYLSVTTTSGNGTSATPAVNFTDADSGVSLAVGELAVALNFAGPGTNGTNSQTTIIKAKASVAIQTGVTLNGAIGTGVYSYYARLEAL